MLQRKELEAKTVDELRRFCKENQISYYEGGKRLAKGPMIDRILAMTEGVETNNQISKEEEEKERLEKLKKKMSYIENAEIGTIVAFKPQTKKKVISAMIMKKSTKGRRFLVETEYGAEFKISFDDVLWVRTGSRWPKGIYLLLKQNAKVEVTK